MFDPPSTSWANFSGNRGRIPFPSTTRFARVLPLPGVAFAIPQGGEAKSLRNKPPSHSGRAGDRSPHSLSHAELSLNSFGQFSKAVLTTGVQCLIQFLFQDFSIHFLNHRPFIQELLFHFRESILFREIEPGFLLSSI